MLSEKTCSGKFPVKQTLDNFSQHSTNTRLTFWGLAVLLISVSSGSKRSNVRIRCRSYENQTLFTELWGIQVLRSRDPDFAD